MTARLRGIERDPYSKTEGNCAPGFLHEFNPSALPLKRYGWPGYDADEDIAAGAAASGRSRAGRWPSTNGPAQGANHRKLPSRQVTFSLDVKIHHKRLPPITPARQCRA